MTDRYKKIRNALAMEPTPGPWLVCPTNYPTHGPFFDVDNPL